MSVTGSASSTNNLKVLKGKISSLAPYAVDHTLSVEGSAAEAKAVGDALEKKVSFTDIVDNLNTNDAELPLSAKQGVELKKSINTLQVQTEEIINETQANVVTAQNTADRANTAAEDAQEYARTAQESADGKMPPDGSVPMTGNLDMGDNRIVNVSDPEEEDDAVNKKYVDSKAGSKTYAFEVTLSKSNWASTTGEAPYTQSVNVADILSTDKPHYSVVYSDNVETAKAEKEAFALVDDLDTETGKVTFTAFEERPEVDLTIQLEVNR